VGCDIHSLAEVRDPKTGEWRKIGNVFDYPWSTLHRTYTAEIIEKIPKDALDGYLLDAVEHQIRNRDGFGKTDDVDYYSRYFPDIPKGSALANKAVKFGQKLSAAVEGGRENRDVVDKFATYPGEHDPDGWARYIHSHKKMYGAEANLSEEERQTLIRAILSHNLVSKSMYEDDDDERDDALWSLDLNFHRFHGGGWFARYRKSVSGVSIDDPEYLDDGLPFWDPEFSFHDEPLDSRNYTLFGALANVRNASQDGQRIEPISEPKGVPDDATPQYKKLVKNWGVDGHSHTYLTLAEIHAYDLDGDVTYTGLVSETQYLDLIEKGYPEDPYVGPSSWAGGIGGAGIVTFTEDGYKHWVEIGRPYIRQPESVSFLAPDIHVSPEHLPEGPVDPGVASLQAAPAFQDRFNAVTMEEATAGKVDTMPGVPEGALDESHQRYSYNGVKPYIQITWKQKRDRTLGSEFRAMVEKFEQIVADSDLLDEDVRLVCFFDN